MKHIRKKICVQNFLTAKESSQPLHPLTVYIIVILSKHLPNVRYYTSDVRPHWHCALIGTKKMILLQVQATASHHFLVQHCCM